MYKSRCRVNPHCLPVQAVQLCIKLGTLQWSLRAAEEESAVVGRCSDGESPHQSVVGSCDVAAGRCLG